MMIVGMVHTKEEALEITFIAKSFVVGNRARELGKDSLKTKKKGVKK